MLRAVVSDSKVTATELAELAAARKRLNIDNSTNVLCLRDIRMTPRQFDRMVLYQSTSSRTWNAPHTWW